MVRVDNSQQYEVGSLEDTRSDNQDIGCIRVEQNHQVLDGMCLECFEEESEQ